MQIVYVEAEEQASSVEPDESVHYHVFLSFRGPDTRVTFTDNLYRELAGGGYHVFRDDDEIPPGQNIKSQLKKAIQESRISVVVFSKDYASSKWCLDELAMIMKRHREDGHHVLPVFYNVDPSDVRNQRGSFAESFDKHDKDFKEEMDRVEGWRAALREAGALKGVPVMKDRYEFDIIKEIVKMVGNQVRLKILNVAPNLVGRKSVINSINSWMLDGSTNVGIATIHGIGGIGKTTIAKEVYNMNFQRFEGSCFLEDVREMSQRHGLVYLQTKLLQDLRTTTVNPIFGVSEGTATIKHVVSYKRVLLILDDVDDMDQYDKLIGKKEWFSPGSKIIITTKLNHIPRAHERDKIYEIGRLGYQESLKLLSWHAFGQDHPKHGYEECSRDFVCYCGGLPLALQVLGSSLSGTTTDVWESELEKLEAHPNRKIQDVLQISYDSLPDHHDKKLFLDVACFYNGVDINYAIEILEGCGFKSAAGIRNLMDRCLISVNHKGKLRMHQLIRDMGRDLARQESLDNPGKRRRVWDNEDVNFVLTENTGTDSVKGLSLSLPVRDSNSTQSPTTPFSSQAFVKMKNLQLLNLSNVELAGHYKNIPRTLVWLHWCRFSLTYIPNDLCLDKLAVLEMPYSKLRYVWKGHRHLEHLKVLDLRHSQELTTTPNFKGLPGLQILVLKGCINLKEVDESIGDLVKLESLNLQDCKSIHLKLPVLKSLEELNISGCPSLGDLPEVLMKFESLKSLNAEGMMIKNFREVKWSWMQSALWFWQLPKSDAQSICFKLDFFPRKLIELNLANCGLSDKLFNVDLSCISSLKFLDLSGNSITRLPESIKQLQLDMLLLDRCSELQSVSVVAMRYMSVRDCKSLERIETQGGFFQGTPFIVSLHCPWLVEVGGYYKLEPLGNIDSEVKKNLGLGNIVLTASTDDGVLLFNTMVMSLQLPSIQVSHEYALHSVFLPGGAVDPDHWFLHHHWPGEGDNISFHLLPEGDSISFHLLPVLGYKLIGFSLWLKYCSVPHPEEDNDIYLNDLLDFCLAISNETTGKRYDYEPLVHGVPGLGEDVLWLSYWRLEELGLLIPLGEGDHTKLAFLPSTLVAKEWGIRLIYQDEEEEEESIPRQPSPWFYARYTGRQTLQSLLVESMMERPSTIVGEKDEPDWSFRLTGRDS